MTDERLAEIRRGWRSQVGIESQGVFAARHVPDLLDEIMRLGSVIDEYKEVIELHHADFVKIKREVQTALARLTVRGRAPQSWVAETFQVIDRIVR